MAAAACGLASARVGVRHWRRPRAWLSAARPRGPYECAARASQRRWSARESRLHILAPLPHPRPSWRHIATEASYGAARPHERAERRCSSRASCALQRGRPRQQRCGGGDLRRMSLPASSSPPPHGRAQGGHGGGAHRAAGHAAPTAASSKGFRHSVGVALASPLGAAVTRAAAYSVGASVAGVVTARALEHPVKALRVEAIAKDGLAGLGNIQDGLGSIQVGLRGIGLGLVALAAATAFSRNK